MNSIVLSPKYRNHVWFAVVLQAILGGLMPDGGTPARIAGIALVGFWGAVAVHLCRCPMNPSEKDLQWIRYGYILALAIAVVLVPAIWSLRGVL